MSLNLLNQDEFFTTDKVLDKYLQPDDPMVIFSKEIYPTFQDEDFKEFYSTKGRNGISPAFLSMVTLLQFKEHLSDTEAKESCIRRIDWKIALHIPLEEIRNFDPSTLCYFRRRLRGNDALSLIFDKTVQFAIKKKFIKKRTNQRIDATHIIAHVNRISTTDLLFRTVKCLVEEIEKRNLPLYEKEVSEHIKERYSNDFSSFGMSKDKRADKQVEIVEDGLYLKKILERLPADECGEYQQLQIMEKIFEENVIIKKKEVDNKEFIEVEEIQRPKQTIFNPRDTELKMGVKGKKSWVGSKCHVVETAEKESANFITDMIYQPANENDNKILDKLEKSIERSNIEVEKLYCDSNYLSGKKMKEYEDDGKKLMGYLAGESSPKPEGFKVSDFKVDMENRIAICPAGEVTNTFVKYKDNKIHIRFEKKVCCQCVNFQMCVGKFKEKRRVLKVTYNHKQIQKRREEQNTEEFKKEMKVRAQVEGTISEAVRFHGLRYKKYKGSKGDQLQFYLTGAAINLKRILRIMSGKLSMSVG